MSLEAALDLLSTVATVPDRAAALALASESCANEALRRFLGQRAHLAVRGGARALLREALAEPLGSSARVEADRFVETRGTLGIRLKRIATTRVDSAHDARLRTIETGGREVGRAAFSADATRVVAFVSGDPAWVELSQDWGDWVGQWSVATGEPVGAVRAGRFREGSGTFDESPSGTRIAVRSHRSTHVHSVEPTTGAISPRASVVRDGSEGANRLTFVDDVRLLANNGYELVLFDATTGDVTAIGESVGSSARACSTRLGKVFIGGGMGSTASLAIHELPSLELVEFARANVAGEAPLPPSPSQADLDTEQGAILASAALSPSEEWLATGDWQRSVRLWKVADLVEGGGGTVTAPRMVFAPRIGTHDAWVEALAFVDDQRLLSGAWDGTVLDWDLANPERAPRALCGHSGSVMSLAVHRHRTCALSAASDGNLVLWDLTTGETPPPPLWMRHGGHPLPVVLRRTPSAVHVSVGHREVVFDPAGTLLETRTCEPPRKASKTLGFLAIEGFEFESHEAIKTTIEITDTQANNEFDDHGVWPGHALVLWVGDTAADIVTLDARALAAAWVDDETIVILDKGGHVSFWRQTAT
jgi:hypothetical protein